MIEIESFFADTYALIEMAGGNPRYQPYIFSTLFTTQWNLAELYYHFLTAYSQEVADRWYAVYGPLLIPITDAAVHSAMQFKLMHKKEKLSYVDCIGHALAQELNIKFLTGDQKFEHKENVEFVK